MTTATHLPPGFQVTKLDGQTIYHRVPIFAVCSRGELNFDAKWMAAAVAEAKQQERDGYLPPLHIRHHEPATEHTDSVRAAGVFRITDAGPLSFKGNRITAIFADLIITDEFLAEEVAMMRYPYRSVEIFEPDGEPKINGLALLDHEAPYLELPMLFAGEVADKRNGVEGESVALANTFSLNYANVPNNPMLGSVLSGKRAVLLFKFPDEEDMNDKNKSNNFADGKDDKDKDPENMEGGELDVSALCESIKSGQISIADMDSILEAIQSQGSTEEEPEADKDEPAQSPAPGADILKGNSDSAKLFARQQGKIDALEAKDALRDATDKRRTEVAEAMTLLDGKPLGADLETRLTNFHIKANGNSELFKEYVDTMAKVAGNMPADNSGADFAAHPKTPKSAMAFQSLGGEAVDKAAGFAREHAQMKSQIRASEESYVKINMARAGFTIEDES